MRRITAILAVLLLAGCGSAAVPWGDYAPTLQGRIDARAASGDCAGLQAEFDTAIEANDATRARTGHGNSELVDYIDTKMRSAGCYR